MSGRIAEEMAGLDATAQAPQEETTIVCRYGAAQTWELYEQ